MLSLTPLRLIILLAVPGTPRALELSSFSIRGQHGGRSDELQLPPPPPSHSVVPLPSYTVSLNLAPRQRWQKVVRENRKELIEIMDWWVDTMAVTNASLLEQWSSSHDIEEEYIEEMRGIVEVAEHPKVTLRNLVLLQLMYELDWPHFCTSIIAASPNGTVVHGRNFDYYGEGGLTLMVTFERDGEELFTEVTRPGLVGVHTAFRVGGYSVAMNKRTVMDRGFQAAANLLSAQNGGRSYMLLLRRTLERAKDFSTALTSLSRAKFAAPLYLSLAGSKPFEGAVVTADGCQPGGSESMDVRRLDRSEHWFLVQANEDQWRPRHGRRHLRATKELLHMGQAEVSQEKIRTVLTKPPLLFNYMTQFTWVMTASTGSSDMVLADQSWRKSAAQPAFARERRKMVSGRLEWDLPKNYMEALDALDRPDADEESDSA